MADDSLSDDDKALFREQMRSVKPLKPGKAVVKEPVRPPLPTRKKPPIANSKPINSFLSDFLQETVLTESILSYAHPSLANKRFRELKNGHIHWEARLDLHGLKADNARDLLHQFINSQTEQDKRCVLIIHGKGGHQGAPPVIKNLVNRWLPQLDQVLAFHSALPKDGGPGAVYVLLKRNREQDF